MQDFIEQVALVIGAENVLNARRLALRNHGWCDGSLDAGLLLRPGNVSEISEICKLASKHGVGLVPHGGLTGLVDGTVSAPGEAVISTERLIRILRVDPTQAVLVAESGVTLQQAHAAAAEHGMTLGVDIPSRGSCTLGGIVSTNAGGVRVLRYGMTRENLLGLEAVLSDGRCVNAMNTLMKNNAGFDLKQLFIGTEGVLGLVTKVVFKLFPKPLQEQTAMIACQSLDDIVDVLGQCRAKLGSNLLSFELVWGEYYGITTSQSGFGPRPLAADYQYYGIIETGVWSEEEAGGVEDSALALLLQRCLEKGVVLDAVMAKSETERLSIWRSREDSEAVGDAYPQYMSYDVGFEAQHIAPFVEKTRNAVNARWPDAQLNFFGHIGDGNLHVMIGITENQYANEYNDIDDVVYAVVGEFSGSTVSAEHGIGTIKRRHLGQSRTPVEITLMRQLKGCLDPESLLNRGKVV